jgi:hypothetical protein
MKLMKNKSGIWIGILTVFAAVLANAADDANKTLLAGYENVRAALAADDLGAAKKAGNELKKKALEVKNETLAKQVNELFTSDSLEKARNHFKTISETAIKLADGKSEYILMTCPMANADWIQTNKKIENPYMGKKMLSCGMEKQGAGSEDKSKTSCCPK